jgi:SAM-dependent methyltransferase
MEGCDLPDYDPATYGDRMAEVYDEWFGTPADAEEAVAFLSDLAGRGRVLELGIGTGRVALPLAGKGIEVHGIDVSEAMVKRLRAKPAGDAIPVSIGDFAAVGARSHGPPGRAALAPALGRLAPRTFHRLEHEPRLGL